MASPIMLVTGATSGIGEATARLAAEQHFRLIICGRRADRLEKLKAALQTHTEVMMLSFDVRDERQVAAAFQSLPTPWQEIDVLVNNAGNAHGLDPIQTGKIADWDAMIDINVKGLLYVSHHVIPGMVNRKRGHIVNLGSIAGKQSYPNGNVYCASKSAVDALTESMRLDLNPFGIKVTGIHPGMVETEFSLVRFKGDAPRAQQVYQGLTPLTGHDIAELILFAVTRPPHVVLADILVLPLAQASAAVLNRQLS
jgi:NADP-dependent 3-hydroxy acid dehydrogenase YdfG